eukprot:c11364_g1_i1.p1 GENE.c11364_g1_i1~~c11364_g1_i1.p1  ORF type:complete len:283 (+),score=11.04 c11364_g1_i1:34-882(+)
MQMLLFAILCVTLAHATVIPSEDATFDENLATWACDGKNATTTIYDTTGYIQSQNGAQYGNDWFCKWVVITPTQTYPSTFYVKFVFETFAVEQGFDQVRLYRDTTYTSQVESTFTSANVPALNNENRYSGGYGLSVIFQTDFSGTAAGFRARFEIVTTLPTYWCDGRTTPIAPVERHTLIGDRAGYYDAGWNCKWTIAATSNQQISMKFNEFNTRPSVDYVRVYSDPNYTTQVGVYSGSSLPPNVVGVVGRGMSVTFVTVSGYASNQYPGFILEYQIYDLEE